MKIAKLHAEKVHGYLPIDVEFFDDLTFLTGLNGSGKTSALRLLMALLTPNLDDLGSIAFSRASVTVIDEGITIVVSTIKEPDCLRLAISTVQESLIVTSTELELFMEAKKREEPRSPILEKYLANPVFEAIHKMSSPMFLGLDRRFFVPTIAEDANESRRREYMARRYWPEEPGFRSTAVAAGLVEVNFLVVTRMQEIRSSQEQLDEKLRGEFFTKAFEYKPSDMFGRSATPSSAELERYRGQLAKIEKAAEGVKIPVPAIQSALTHFFERMSNVVDALDRNRQAKKGRKVGKKPSDKTKSEATFPDKDYVDWIVNRPQAERILEHLDLLGQYIENRNALRDPINRFLSLVNGFLAQTNKQVAVANTGQLTVSVIGNPDARSIAALSSGERQLLVMLAHLSLNPSLAGSGVFIVDEPELSLHIDWQEKFVDAIREANPKVQLILATHSPAIILDQTDACRSLS